MDSEHKKECSIDLQELIESFVNLDAPSPWVRPNRLWYKNYTEKIPKTINYENFEKINGLFCLLELVASRFPNNIAVYFKPKEEKYSYREVLYFAKKIASALQDLGVKKGDPVALNSTNCSEFIFAMWACMKLGAVLVPINPLLKEREIAHILRETGNVKIAIVHEKVLDLFKRSSKEFNLKKLVLIGGEQGAEDRKEEIKGVQTYNFNQLLKKYAPIEDRIPIEMKEDLFCLLYTGGTTGLPKGVMLSHFNYGSCLFQINSFNEEFHKEDHFERLFGRRSILNVLPLCHTFGLASILLHSISGNQLIVFDSFDAKSILETLETQHVEYFNGVPTMFLMLANHPDFTKHDLTSIKYAIGGGAALAPAIIKKWEEIVGVEVRQGYGLTEASIGTNLQPHMWAKWIPKSIGMPIVDTEIKIVDPESLEELEPGQRGEFLIRGPQVMMGYWKNPEATARVLIKDAEGKKWLRTGDIGYMDENGYFYISGRTKEMIKYKGYRILPAEVEAGLYEHPAVSEVGVIGIPDDLVGENIKAFIVLKSDYKDTKAEAIIEWSKEHLAGYKWPRKVEFVTNIPKTAVGKVMRRALREQELKKQEK